MPGRRRLACRKNILPPAYTLVQHLTPFARFVLQHGWHTAAAHASLWRYDVLRTTARSAVPRAADGSLQNTFPCRSHRTASGDIIWYGWMTVPAAPTHTSPTLSTLFHAHTRALHPLRALLLPLRTATTATCTTTASYAPRHAALPPLHCRLPPATTPCTPRCIFLSSHPHFHTTICTPVTGILSRYKRCSDV